MQRPASNRLANRFESFVTGRRAERYRTYPAAVATASAGMCSRENRTSGWDHPGPVIILAVDDLRLLRMQRQTAVREPLFQRAAQVRSLSHSCSDRSHRPHNARTGCRDGSASSMCRRRSAETGSPAWGLSPHPEAFLSPGRRGYYLPSVPVPSAISRYTSAPTGTSCACAPPAQQRPVDAVEEGLDIKIQDPPVTPASLPCHPDCIERRLAGSISIGILVEHRLHKRLQVSFDHHLGDTIGNRWHAPIELH